MWLLKNSPGLLTDLYELTMAQVYFNKDLNEQAYFELFTRALPSNWAYFVMGGLAEINSFIQAFSFSNEDIKYLKSLGVFSQQFLEYLSKLIPKVSIRSLPEGTVFFPNEPVLEVGGPLIHAQILESYILNILGFSIIEATLASRIMTASKGRPVVDFGLRRSQGPIASIRAARAGQIAGFKATSNVIAAKLLNFTTTGTMAHSYIEVHETEINAFENFIDHYGQSAILLIDTYDPIEGIKKAAQIAKKYYDKKALKIKGIRIDSGDFVKLSKFAREHFKGTGVDFLKIFISSGLDEFRIAKLLDEGAEADGFGVGTRYAVSHNAPDLDIVYKIIEYAGKGLYKTSPDKHTRPRRKTIIRSKEETYTKDTIVPYRQGPGDLLVPFKSPEPIETIQKRLSRQMNNLHDSVKAIKNPQSYNVEFAF